MPLYLLHLRLVIFFFSVSSLPQVGAYKDFTDSYFFQADLIRGAALQNSQLLNQFWYLYRNNLKNRFLTASALPQNFCSHSRLAHAQWSLAPNTNSEEPPGQIPDSSDCFGISSFGTSDPFLLFF